MFNKVLSYTQKFLNPLYEKSLLLQNLDKLIFTCLLSVFVLSVIMPSDVIGIVAVAALILTLIKVLIKQGEKFEPNTFELFLTAYFMLVVISLAGSTLFALSFKGILKTITYIGFYLSIVHYLKSNKDKIPYFLLSIGICISIESIVGIMQNFSHVEAISTWQDTSNLNPEQVMTRIYGTLKPYNPNLLGGYFVAGLPTLFGLSASFLSDKKICPAVICAMGGIVGSVVLFLTGCRGAYIACFVIYIGIFMICAKFLWNKYRKLFSAILSVVIISVFAAIIFLDSLRARIFSIFAMRQDSSNSFRFNVYQSSLQMFKDNWLLGIGVGNKNFREIYGLYMRTGFDALSAYNIFLEIAVESGIFALITFIGFVFIAVKNGIKVVLNSSNIKNVIYVSTAIISIMALMVHGLVDTVFFRPQIQFIFWTMAAIVSCCCADEKVA